MPSARAREKSRRSSPEPAALRKRFLEQISAQTPLYGLFNLLPDHAFCAKDLQFRIVCASRQFHERFGFPDEASVLGRDDFELFPSYLAQSFRSDDEEVMATGQPKLNIMELFFTQQGIPDWFVTHKLPLRDRRGRVMGLMGVSQAYASAAQPATPHEAVGRAVAHISAHFRGRISVEELSARVHLSPRQLHRKFIEAFALSPQAFIMKVRMRAACEALRAEGAQIGRVAEDLGYCDQSAFTEHFRRHMGTTPLRYQRQFRLGGG
jgi:AraC-like DNA-binding protein